MQIEKNPLKTFGEVIFGLPLLTGFLLLFSRHDSVQSLKICNKLIRVAVVARSLVEEGGQALRRFLSLTVRL